MTDGEPYENGDGGRGPDGRFRPGCKAGPGSPLAKQAIGHRQAVLKAIRPADVGRILKALLRKALDGDTGAAREILDRVIGKPMPVIFDEDGDGEVTMDVVACFRALLTRRESDADE